MSVEKVFLLPGVDNALALPVNGLEGGDLHKTMHNFRDQRNIQKKYSDEETEDSKLSLHESKTVHVLIPGKLSMAIHATADFTRAEIQRRPDLFYFSTDLHERYIPLCRDFGPVSLGVMYQFWQYTKKIELNPRLRGRPLVYYAGPDERQQANAAFLLGAYMVLEHNYSPREVARVFDSNRLVFSPFRDATFLPSDFGLTLENCWDGLEKAVSVGWFDKETFDLNLYDDLEDPDAGDMSLIGERFLAFRGPSTEASEDDHWAKSPTFFVPKFKDLGVTTVIRLNEPTCYDKQEFEEVGIKVYDLEFPDCTCPSPTLIQSFLDIVDSTEGIIAVHCMAGLGRTGTMIGLWMMKNLLFSAREAITWLRLCRPGSVIGMQQHFLQAVESMVWEGNTLIPCTVKPQTRRQRRQSQSSGLSGSSSSSPRGQVEVARTLFVADLMASQVDYGSRQRLLLRREK